MLFSTLESSSLSSHVRDLELQDGEIHPSEDAFFVVNKPGLPMSIYLDDKEDDSEFGDDDDNVTT